MNDKLIKSLKKLIRETIDEKLTEVQKSWTEMMANLEKEIKKPVVKDDAGNYNVCECDPHHFSIRPVAQDIYNVEYFKDTSDREKKLYVHYEELKKFIKEKLSSKDLNYVDTAYSRNIDNSKDKEGGKKADKQAVEQNLVDPEKDNKVVKAPKMDSMNKEVDDPTQPMREVGKFEKQVDYKSPKPNYKPPTLPKNLQKLVVKYTKGGKTKKK